MNKWYEKEAVKVNRIIKSATPELTDLKITNWCSNACRFCYQGSNIDGKHADIYDIFHVIDVLSDNECFEISLAGGDVVSHPYFLTILQYIKDKNMTPNFTTRMGYSGRWMRDDFIKETVIRYCGGVAFSVGDLYDYNNLMKVIKEYNFPKEKVVIHLTMGVVSEKDYINILTFCAINKIQVTLLGFKETEHNKDFKNALDYKDKKLYNEYNEWWLSNLMFLKNGSSGIYKVGIDTKMVQDFEDDLRKYNISEVLWTKEEGKFSCYIDVVEKIIAPSSYNGEKIKYNDENELMEIYAKF